MPWTDYQSTSTILDVTVTELQPNVPMKSPDSGSYTKGTSTIEVTTNTINSTALNNGQIADAYELIIIPPVDADGSTPDVEVTFQVDGTDLSEYQVIDGSADGNVFANPQLLVGQAKRILLGLPMRSLLRNIAKGQSVKNLPLLVTGLKPTSSINVTVTSATGWGQTGNAVTPMRIILKGDLMVKSDIDGYSNLFQAASSIGIAEPGFQAVSIPYLNIAGSLSANWAALPGGARQGSLKIQRGLRYATNGVATGTNGIFVFSQKQSLQGSQNNVSDDHHDLGDDFSSNDNVFVWQEFGVRLASAVQAFLGFRIDGTVVPQDTPYGTPISQSINPFHYGSVQPIRPESNLYFAPGKTSALARILSYKNAVAPFISTSGTTSIPIGDVKMFKGGVILKHN